MKNFLKFLPFLLVTVLISSCSSDDDSPAPVNEEETITTVTVTFTPQGGGTTVTLTSRDLDGDGPDAPVNTVSGPFAANTTYNGTVKFENELESPAEDITEEVEEEGDEHQIFYAVTNGIGTFDYTDTDVDGNPVGLTFTFQTITPVNPVDSSLSVTLRHEPNKAAAGVVEGDITNAGGSTDAQVTFDVVLQ